MSLLGRIAAAAGDRIKTAGDILDYDEFFCDDEQLVYDEKAFDKRLRKGDAADSAAEVSRPIGVT